MVRPYLSFPCVCRLTALPKTSSEGGLLGLLPVGLPLLWAVNPVEPDTFSAVVVQDVDGVTVEDRNDGAGEVGSERFGK